MLNPMDDLEGKFVIRDEDEVIEYDRCGDLPDEFDHLIEFAPISPEPPHTEEQHHEMSKYTQYLQELVSRERK